MNLNLRVFVFSLDRGERGKTYQELDLWLKEQEPSSIHTIWQDKDEVRVYFTTHN